MARPPRKRTPVEVSLGRLRRRVRKVAPGRPLYAQKLENGGIWINWVGKRETKTHAFARWEISPEGQVSCVVGRGNDRVTWRQAMAPSHSIQMDIDRFEAELERLNTKAPCLKVRSSPAIPPWISRRTGTPERPG